MPLETNLNATPYFDDFDEAKKFYKILFQPGVAVQTRELNQLQTILQSQIERFGNHVFKNGTIISGINFEYIPYYPYVKLKDTSVIGQPVDLVGYQPYWLRNSSNLVSKVVNYKTGVESQNPDVGTLYVRYLNSGSSNSTLSYSPSEVLTVFDIEYPVFSVKVNNGGANFSNSDTVVFLSALVVNTVSGSFATNDVIVQATTGAKAVVIESNTTIIPGSTVLKIKPQSADLTNTSANTSLWTFEPGYLVSNSTNSANVVSLVGSGAIGEVITLSTGIVSSIQLTSVGSGYVIPPYTTIKPVSATGAVATLNLESQNYLTQITVANTTAVTAPVGNGYAFGVTDGIIYQKGHFLKTDKQVVIVDKYSSAPNNVVVGFDTAESIVTSAGDTTLLDNATGAPNYAAPGANRMKLTPELVVLSKNQAEANTSFLPLVEFVEGFPYKENRVTVYNTLAKEFERRTHESAGDYVVDPFTVSTKELLVSNGSPNTTHFQVVVDPGVGYIAGQRVETLRNTLIEVPKATTTRTSSSQLVTASYGQYVVVKEMAGSFNVVAGAQISLRSAVGEAITNTSVISSITAPGSEIGTARVRSVVYNSGIVGTPDALYEVYLFDVKMNSGYNFRDVRSLYYNGSGSADGLADCNLELDPSLNANVAVLKQTSDRQLVFNTGIEALKVVNAASYTFKTTDTANVSANTTGYITVSLTQTNETFPYTPSSNLSDSQKEDFIFVPTANLQATANLGGSVVVTNNAMVGTSTSFVSDLRVGDYVKVANTTANQVFRISAISNSTYATVSANATTMNTITANVVMFFPAFRPLNMITRSARTVAINGNANVATAYLGTSLSGTSTVLSTFNVRKTNATQLTRAVYRDAMVKLQLSNNAATTDGPWCLGIPDGIRLKNVYIGSNSSVSTSDLDVTKYFYLGTGQNNDFYGHSLLYKNKGSNLTLTGSDFLLVKFDVLDASSDGGFSTVSSFSIDDTKKLADATNTINTLEIPEFGSVDLRNAIDFRPVIATTAAVTNVAASATLNPANTITFSSDPKYFPVPDSSFNYTAEYYLSRKDRVVLTRNGEFEVIQGNADTERLKTPTTPLEALSLGVVTVPAYPSVGYVLSNTTSQIVSKSVGDGGGLVNNKGLRHLVTVSSTTGPGQPQQYTMRDIVNLENRIKTLEYQASFNTLENDVNRVNIPSSLDPTMSRFKNGFFVDSFVDFAKVDQQHPEFGSYIDVERGELSPDLMHINLQMQFKRTDTTTNNALVANSTLMLPFTEYAVVTQPKATSTVQSEGNRSQFVGEMIITPAAFNVEAIFERSVTINLHREPSGGGNYGSCGLFKIICTKLYELGYLPHDIFVADQKFGEQLRDNDPEAYFGYIKWARIVVDWMEGKGPQCMFWIRDPQKRALAQKELAIKWARRIATPWALHMAYIMGVRADDNRAGRAIMKTGLFVSRVVGKLFKDQKQTPTTSTAIGFGMWGVFALFYVLAGIKDRKA